MEKPLSIYLNDNHVITAMTVGDYPDYLAVGYLVNQNIIKDPKKLEKIEVVDDINAVIVRSKEKTVIDISNNRKIKTSGCANGTIFDSIIDQINEVKLEYTFKVRADEIFNLYKIINLTPSLYLKSGAIHGCVLCTKEKPLVFFEDVGRHNAIDKLAGYMFIHKIDSKDKVLYTTGRLTSEMVIKSVMMEIPIIASRSGYTAWAVELAKKSNLTMIGRLRGRKYTVLSGYERLIAE